MSISSGTVLRVVATMLWTDGNVMQNVFNAVIAGGSDPYDADDVVAEAITWLGVMYANIVGAVSDEVDGSEITVYEYDSIDDDWDEVGSGAFSWDPTATSDQLPRGNACLINLKTLDPDVNGKKYIGGWTESNVADGLLSAASLAILIDFAIDWFTGFTGATTGATWTPGVWSPTNTVFKAARDAAVVPAIMAYQRRRKRGVGI